jgi:acyl-CoA synthetase (AMP-forming)/AMP-acid ligase II
MRMRGSDGTVKRMNLVSQAALIPPLVGEFTSVGDSLEAASQQFAECDAFVEGQRRLNYGDWFRAADGLARVLVEGGVKPGDRVALLLPSTIDYAIAYAGALLAGAIATGLSMRLGSRELAAILDRADPKVVIIDRGALATPLPKLADDVTILEHHELPSTYAGNPLGVERPQRGLDDPAVIIWTSGTTGVPKGALFDYRNLYAAVVSAGIMSAPFDRKLVGTPFPHAGFMAKIWDQIAWGTAIVISETPWTAESMLRSIVDHGITTAGGVPTQWAKLLQLPGIEEVDFSQVRIGLVATAPAPPELVERVTSIIGCPLIVRYAMTESPSISGTDPGDDPEILYRTVGRASSGMAIEVVDENGIAKPHGEVGRVRVSGACVMRGYWGDPELTASVLDGEGRLTSTDLGRFDDAGNLVLVGRSSDMYIRGGYNVYPLEVENLLSELPQVASVAIVGMAAPVIGEIGVAFVVAADPSQPPTLDDLRAYVRERLSDYKAPDRLELVTALPLTAMMKVDKIALKEGLALKNASDAPPPRPTR